MQGHLRDTALPQLGRELERGLLPRWLERIDRDIEHVRVKAEALAARESTSADDQLYTLAEDPRARLRGLPAIGRGVAGAIRGTQPEQAALRKLSR